MTERKYIIHDITSKGFPTISKQRSFITTGWKPELKDVLKTRGKVNQKEALIKFLSDHKDDADLVASASWLLLSLSHGYVHLGKQDDTKVERKSRNPKKVPQVPKPRPIPDDAVVHVMSGDNLPIFFKNYRLDGGEIDYILEFGLDGEGTAWLVGWSVYPSGQNTDYWKNQTIAVMFDPILGCSSTTAMSEYTEYSYDNWGGEEGASLSVTDPSIESIYLECAVELRVSSTAPDASISGVKSFASSKRLKTSESTAAPITSTSTTTTTTTTETTGQKKRKATDK